MLTGAQLTQLKTELATDPRAYGYTALLTTQNWNAVRDLLNLTRTGVNGGPAITIRRTDIGAADVYAAIDVADYTALPGNPNATQLSTERRFLAWLSGIAALSAPIRLVDDAGADTPVIKNFRAMFAGGTGTLTRLTALASRNGSRAEELFGRDVLVSDGEVEQAWRLP